MSLTLFAAAWLAGARSTVGVPAPERRTVYVAAPGIESHARLAMIGTLGRRRNPVGTGAPTATRGPAGAGSPGNGWDGADRPACETAGAPGAEQPGGLVPPLAAAVRTVADASTSTPGTRPSPPALVPGTWR